MANENLAAWQKQMGYTYESAAEALGISRATYGRFLKDGAPLYISLACAALAAGLSPLRSTICIDAAVVDNLDREAEDEGPAVSLLTKRIKLTYTKL